GFHFSDTINFNGNPFGISYSDGTGYYLKISSINLGSGVTPYLVRSGGTAGIYFAGSMLHLCSGGKWFDIKAMLDICLKMAGKTIAFPSGIDSTGKITGYYNAIAMPSITTWNG
ncbi:hypothetical protein, partial [Enterococcus faecalis]|uniref:hypothetical protein n=1 Tax=Enterococcus faecalis TaxID=1351 RepID=UPI003D6B60E0